MSDLLQEYLYEYEMFSINQDTNEQLFQLECGFINESTGLITLHEALIDTLVDWFKKIVQTVTETIEKLKLKIDTMFKNRLANAATLMGKPNKTDPASLEIPVTNFHQYDFTKFRDGTYDANKAFTNPDYIKVVAGIVGGNGEKPENLDKKSVLKACYPSLYDDNLSIFDKMREGIIISGKDTNQQTFLTMEIVDDAWEFVTEGYQSLLEKITQDKDYVASQKKNVDAAAQQLSNAIQSQGAPQQQQESFVFCEQYLTEAPTAEKDKPIKAQKIEDGKGGVNKEVYIKAVMTYIQVAVDVISAKMKSVNSAFMDKFRILIQYIRRAK